MSLLSLNNCFLDYLREESWSTQLNLVQGLAVGLYDAVDSVDFRIIRVEVHIETVVYLSVNFGAETVQWYLLVGIIVEEDFGNCRKCVFVVIWSVWI